MKNKGQVVENDEVEDLETETEVDETESEETGDDEGEGEGEGDTEVEARSLYQEFVDVLGIPFSEDDFSVEEYKQHITRTIDNRYPEDADFEAAFSEDAQSWVADATKIMKENRQTKGKKKNLPAMDGLPGEKAKKGKTTAAKGKTEKEKKERGPNRYLRAFRYILEHPNTDAEKLAKGVAIAAPAGKYCLEAFEAAQTAFKEAGKLK